jgi:exodeoxyribonuclease-3
VKPEGGNALLRYRNGVAAAVALLAITVAACGGGEGSDEPSEVTVMSFNIYGGGVNGGKTDLQDTAAAIEAADADIIGVQETRGESRPCTANHCPAAGPSVAQDLAEELGYEVYEQTAENDALWANAILSRYPIGEPTANDTGVEIDVDGKSVHMFNIHLDDSPYGPYQLLDIDYGGFPAVKTEAAAIKWAQKTRGPALDLLFEDMDAAGDADATFVTGDFNEPSGLDWTEEVVADGGYQPIKVDWPTTRAITDRGFVDSYREIHPDPVADPAFTWTPSGDPDDKFDHHDRIDFVLAKGDDLEVTDASIVGESKDAAEIVYKPWLSDHRASVATVQF